MLDDLPPKLRAAVDMCLEPGETVRWAAQPRAHRLNFVHVPLFLMGAVSVGLGLGVATRTDHWGAVVGLIFAGLGAFLLYALTASFWEPGKTVYVITDRRLLAVRASGGRPASVTYRPADIQFRKKNNLVQWVGLLALCQDDQE
jgi:hypothetical protein